MQLIAFLFHPEPLNSHVSGTAINLKHKRHPTHWGFISTSNKQSDWTPEKTRCVQVLLEGDSPSQFKLIAFYTGFTLGTVLSTVLKNKQNRT